MPKACCPRRPRRATAQRCTLSAPRRQTTRPARCRRAPYKTRPNSCRATRTTTARATHPNAAPATSCTRHIKQRCYTHSRELAPSSTLRTSAHAPYGCIVGSCDVCGRGARASACDNSPATCEAWSCSEGFPPCDGGSLQPCTCPEPEEAAPRSSKEQMCTPCAPSPARTTSITPAREPRKAHPSKVRGITHTPPVR